MDEAYYVGRLLEAENLTDNLEDADAERLLNWGTQHVGGLLADPAAADERITGLMAVLRGVNRIAPDAAGSTVDELAPRLGELAKAYHRTFGRKLPARPADLQTLALALAGQPTRDSLATLLDWFNKE